MSEKERAERMERFLARFKDVGEKAILAGRWGVDDTARFCLTNADYLALAAHSEQLRQMREQERYTKCIAYMEETRAYWERLVASEKRISLELAQKCWEREAREQFGYTASEWTTPCYEGSGMAPLRHRGAQ